MRILVSGGAGFIGGKLCEKLLAQGHEVFCLDNFISGSFRNIKSLMENPAFRLLEQDVAVALKENPGKLDQIYHLACPGSPADCIEIPLQILWTSAAGTKTMLDLAFRNNAAFLLASDAAVYGENNVDMVKETDFGQLDPLDESSCLAEGKRFAENMAMTYYRDFRFPLKIARMFEVYGPGMRKRDGRILSEFIMAALAHEPLLLPGDGQAKGYFCYVDDMVEGLIQTMNSKDFYGAVNLGHDFPQTFVEMAEKVVAFSGSSSVISFSKGVGKQQVYRQPDLTLAREKIEFEPRTSFEEGLAKSVDFFKSA